MCASCLDNLRRNAAKLRAPAPTGPRPTAADLERHARRFGPALVAETAAHYGLAVDVEQAPRRRRSRGPTLRQRVAELVAAGHGVETIAEMEDLSPSRARRLVQEVSA